MTLIFNGSPRKSGDTVSLINELKAHLKGGVVAVNAYDRDISPCIDCRSCRVNQGCAIRDKWDDIDGILRRCQAVVIATPMHFSQPAGQLMALLSRTQQYFSASYFRGEKQFPEKKRGGVIIVGGGDGSPEKAEETARTLLRLMGCGEIAPMVCCHRTNELPAIKEPDVKEKLAELASFLENRQ